MVIKVTQYLTILLYHYVRDLPNSPYPKIKGLLTKNFIGQLEYLLKYYRIIGIEECIKAFKGEIILPKNACHLTFDDGFIDHFITVFPILKEMKIYGSFFPPAKPILENKVLDVHKIHFILANTEEPKDLIKQIFNLLSDFRKDYDLPEDKDLFQKYANKSRWDPIEVTFIKKLLQYGLPDEIRNSICSDLFNNIVSDDEKAFSSELYMKLNQLKEMYEAGMDIGGHGYEHKWLGKLSENEQLEEIKQTYNFLQTIMEEKPKEWAFSYPRNSYNDVTISILKKFNCSLALTANPGLSIIDQSKSYIISRLDTNFFPYSESSEPNKWTKEILNS